MVLVSGTGGGRFYESLCRGAFRSPATDFGMRPVNTRQGNRYEVDLPARGCENAG